MKKSQTSTEYLVLLVIAIVIALVVVSIMGGFPGIGAGNNKQISDLKLASDTIGIESYQIGADFSLFKIKNNYYDTVTVISFKINNQTNLTCNSSNTNSALPVMLNVGQSKLINCSVVNSSTYALSNRQTPMVGVSYIDNMGATRSAGNEGSSVAISQGQVSPPVTPSYTITFNSNNGTGLMSTQTIQKDASANLIPNNFTKEGYSFVGWNTFENGSGIDYADNSSYTMGSADLTLYAKWTVLVIDACIPADPTNSVCWSSEISLSWSTGFDNTEAQDDNDGAANTDHIVLNHSNRLPYNDGSDYPAAQYCYDLVEGGHDDWYLPAKDQLWAGWIALTSSFFSSEDYWSSTQYYPFPAWELWALHNTMTYDVLAYYQISVRCIR